MQRLGPFARPHLRTLLLGLACAVGIVLMRVALPWPMRALLGPWLRSDMPDASDDQVSLPGGIPPLVAMGASILVMMTVLGLVDHLARLNFARFSIGFTRDVRAKAFSRIARATRKDRVLPASGDMVARLIGDTARLKAGTKGFLVHVATNGLLFLGITAMMLYIDPRIGAVFAGGGVLLGSGVVWGAVLMFNRALEVRKKEGKLASRIDEVQRDGGDPEAVRLNKESGRYEASLSKLQGRFTWLAHTLLGALILAAALIGSGAVAAGDLAPDDLFLVLAYSLMLRSPTVQLARQGVRTGKILACAHRIAQLLKRKRKRKGTTPEGVTSTPSGVSSSEIGHLPETRSS